jgi:hypothetical protein
MRSLAPQHISKSSWYYEEKTHMLFVHENRTADGTWISTDQIKIPWRKIEASLKRVRTVNKPKTRT